MRSCLSPSCANNPDMCRMQSILAVEISQASWVSSAVLKQQPWNGPFTIPLTASGAYSLAREFCIP